MGACVCVCLCWRADTWQAYSEDQLRTALPYGACLPAGPLMDLSHTATWSVCICLCMCACICGKCVFVWCVKGVCGGGKGLSVGSPDMFIWMSNYCLLCCRAKTCHSVHLCGTLVCMQFLCAWRLYNGLCVCVCVFSFVFFFLFLTTKKYKHERWWKFCVWLAKQWTQKAPPEYTSLHENTNLLLNVGDCLLYNKLKSCSPSWFRPCTL